MFRMTYMYVVIFSLIASSTAYLTFDYLSQLLNELVNSSTFHPSSNFESTDPRAKLNAFQLIDYFGYIGETHPVHTEDGYILTLHRIVGHKIYQSYGPKLVVLIQHGLTCSSMNWIISGPHRSLAFLLVNNGFDVWLLNSRGNQYSQNHETKRPTQPEYWNFSFHEMGIFDLSAIIDYILGVTDKKKLIYIGHSQGTTLSYVLLSERPEYNNKISILFSLAPICFISDMNNIFGLVGKYIQFPILTNFFSIIDIKNEYTKSMAYTLCNDFGHLRSICKQIFFVLGGYSDEQFDEELYLPVLQHFPDKASIKQFIHQAQLIKSGHFSKFDYGLLNFQMYGTPYPPKYNLKNIKIHTVLMYADNDLISVPKNVIQLFNKLETKKELIRVNDTKFNHFDFMWGRDVVNLLYNRLLSVILKCK